jgi:hypothetical protein
MTRMLDPGNCGPVSTARVAHIFTPKHRLDRTSQSSSLSLKGNEPSPRHLYRWKNQIGIHIQHVLMSFIVMVLVVSCCQVIVVCGGASERELGAAWGGPRGCGGRRMSYGRWSVTIVFVCNPCVHVVCRVC